MREIAVKPGIVQAIEEHCCIEVFHHLRHLLLNVSAKFASYLQSHMAKGGW